MWISARTATTLAFAALALVMVAVAAPLLPRPQLPSLPEERTVKTKDKLGAATLVIESPERVRSQRMAPSATVPKGAANWAGRVGTGTAGTPDGETVHRLRTLLKDARTVADPRARAAEPTTVVRFVRDGHRVDVMLDLKADRLMVVHDGEPVGAFAISGLHREYANLGATLVDR